MLDSVCSSTVFTLERRSPEPKMSSFPLPVSPVSSSQNLHNVFVYGSLLADDVVRVLLNRIPQSSSALLHDYHRFGIKERIYPAIIPVPNKTVSGRVLLGLTNLELDIFDMFEDVEYERTTVEVSSVHGSEKIQAYTYVWSDRNDQNLYGNWDFEEWEELHKDDFMKMTIGFVENLALPDPKTRLSGYQSF